MLVAERGEVLHGFSAPIAQDDEVKLERRIFAVLGGDVRSNDAHDHVVSEELPARLASKTEAVSRAHDVAPNRALQSAHHHNGRRAPSRVKPMKTAESVTSPQHEHFTARDGTSTT